MVLEFETFFLHWLSVKSIKKGSSFHEKSFFSKKKKRKKKGVLPTQDLIYRINQKAIEGPTFESLLLGEICERFSTLVILSSSFNSYYIVMM